MFPNSENPKQKKAQKTPDNKGGVEIMTSLQKDYLDWQFSLTL